MTTRADSSCPTQHRPTRERLPTADNHLQSEAWAIPERAFRRGAHQSAVLAIDLLDACESLDEARKLFRRVEGVARELREAGGRTFAFNDELLARLRADKGRKPVRDTTKMIAIPTS